ncbi:MAG: bifunctional chorismate mutase/prephenate dehydrogenase [Candidatus Obscuribacterales bacterium]|nr:bifunctional chorismate mutase/prephenate dehydrogenase [Candidatus Obscuribacterales bacterium]
MATRLSRSASQVESQCTQRASNSLSHWRREIDKIDAELAKLLRQRFAIMNRIAEAKNAQAKPVRDSAREAEVLKRAQDSCPESELKPAVTKVFESIIEQSVVLQQSTHTAKEASTPPAETFKSVCIVGAGLIGGALALRIRQVEKSANSTTQLKAVDLPSALEPCQASTIFDQCTDQLLDGIRECDLIVLCAPPETNCSLLKAIAPHLHSNQTVLDVSSVKRPICEIAAGINLNGAKFVGGHPFFGTEKSGFVNSKDVPVDNRTFCLVGEQTLPEVQQLQQWLSSMGFRVVVTTAASHDKVVARTSHLIQLLAVTAGSIIHDNLIEEELSDLLILSGGGLATLSRLMASPSALWEQVLFRNNDEMEAAMSQIEGLFTRLKEATSANDFDDFADILRNEFSKANATQARLTSVMNAR